MLEISVSLGVVVLMVLAMCVGLMDKRRGKPSPPITTTACGQVIEYSRLYWYVNKYLSHHVKFKGRGLITHVWDQKELA
jgi:hypothetical protein